MTKLRDSLSLVLIMLCVAPQCLGANQKEDPAAHIARKLAEAKTKATNLVQEIKASNPAADDLNLLRKYYDFARDAQRLWSEEAADAIEHGKKIDPKSKKAVDAGERYKELGKFAHAYAEKRKADATFAMGLNGKQVISVLKGIAKFINDHWEIIKQVANEINKILEKDKEKTQAMMKLILDSGNWPAFDAIPPRQT
jgi:hypothetical protein